MMPPFRYAFHHLGVAVSDLPKAISTYREALGWQLLSGPFDDPLQEATVCFLGLPGDPLVIELVAPLGPQSKIGRILAQGGGAYHVCYQVQAIDDAVRDLAARKFLIVGQPTPATAFGGRRIAWLYAPTRQLIELVEKAEDA